MALSEEDKKRIEEEEAYRNQVRNGAGKKKNLEEQIKGVVALTVIGGLVYVTLISNSSAPKSIEGSKDKTLNAEVARANDSLAVQNKDDVDWADCKVEINYKVLGSGFLLEIPSIKKGLSSYPLQDFTDSDGVRFDLRTRKLEKVSITCGTKLTTLRQYFAKFGQAKSK